MNLKAIYCVDDDDVINKVLLFQISKFIEHEEIVVETCNHPKECVEMMKENYRLGIEPLVCVVDFQMPEMRGDEFARIVKSLFPKIKIIMLYIVNFIDKFCVPTWTIIKIIMRNQNIIHF